MIPILINKDVFDPRYNDLQFMVWKPQLCLHQPNRIFAWLKGKMGLYLVMQVLRYILHF